MDTDMFFDEDDILLGLVIVFIVGVIFSVILILYVYLTCYNRHHRLDMLEKRISDLENDINMLSISDTEFPVTV